MDVAANPALSTNQMDRFAEGNKAGVMTLSGTLGKIGLTFAVLIAAGVWGWLALPGLLETATTRLLWGGMIALFIVGFWAAIKPGLLSVMLYAALEGFYLGVISRAFDVMWNGIVTQAVLITLCVAVVSYLLYAAGMVKVTDKFRSIVTIATFGVLAFLLVEWILSIFIPGFMGISYSGTWGLIVGLIIVFIASLNLFLDYQVITQGIENELSKKAEWYASFGLVLTLVWLYVSILRVLVNTKSNN